MCPNASGKFTVQAANLLVGYGNRRTQPFGEDRGLKGFVMRDRLLKAYGQYQLCGVFFVLFICLVSLLLLFCLL